MQREQRWRLTYETTDGVVRTVDIREEQRERSLARLERNGYKKLKMVKLYPFSTEKNQHNFELIHNICFNALYDMEMGDKPYDSAEYDRLEDLKDRSERYFLEALPIAWVPWEQWKDMKELANMAIMHRQDACIANGRPDLVAYCAD